MFADIFEIVCHIGQQPPEQNSLINHYVCWVQVYKRKTARSLVTMETKIFL